MNCRVVCEEVGFDLLVPDISEEILSSISLDSSTLKTPFGDYQLEGKYVEWFLSDSTLRNIFEKLNDSLKTDLEKIVRSYFNLIFYQDPYCKDVFQDKKFLNKTSFLSVLKAYNDRYLDSESEDNSIKICPDMLFCTLIYLYMSLYQTDLVLVDKSTLPYILNIEGMSAEEAENAFESDIPYDKKVIDLNKSRGLK